MLISEQTKYVSANKSNSRNKSGSFEVRNPYYKGCIKNKRSVLTIRSFF